MITINLDPQVKKIPSKKKLKMRSNIVRLGINTDDDAF